MESPFLDIFETDDFLSNPDCFSVGVWLGYLHSPFLPSQFHDAVFVCNMCWCQVYRYCSVFLHWLFVTCFHWNLVFSSQSNSVNLHILISGYYTSMFGFSESSLAAFCSSFLLVITLFECLFHWNRSEEFVCGYYLYISERIIGRWRWKRMVRERRRKSMMEATKDCANRLCW